MSSRGDLDVHATVQGGHRNVGAQNGFPGRQLRFVHKVVTFHLKIRVLGKTYPQIEVTGRPAAQPGFSSAGYAQSLALADPGRDLDLVSARFGNLAGPAADVANMARAL